MNHSQQANIPGDELREIKVAFIEAHERGERLDPWLERYPQHARALIDLAIALDAGPRGSAPGEEEVSRTAGALRQALREVAGPPSPQPAPGLAARARAVGLRVPQLAARVRLTSDILYKLDRGVIRLDTVPRGLVAQLATVLGCQADALTAGLSRAPVTATAMYYAHQPPGAPRQQSFAEALAQSEELSEEDRAAWLAVLREEGVPS